MTNPPTANVPANAALPRVLLIDDDLKFGRLLGQFLGAEGFEVSAAPDGAAGLHRARHETWDLIILDVMLPRIDGFEVLRQLRGFSTTPVLMLTARGAESDLIAGLDRGADDYVPKTTSAQTLVARIRALLRRSAVQAEEARRHDLHNEADICVGDLLISLASHAVHRDGQPVELTAIEFALLVDLARNKGRIRTREQLLEQVANRRLGSFDRSVDVHVASLRRKLGDDARAARFIVTVRSAGYLLRDPEHPE